MIYELLDRCDKYCGYTYSFNQAADFLDSSFNKVEVLTSCRKVVVYNLEQLLDITRFCNMHQNIELLMQEVEATKIYISDLSTLYSFHHDMCEVLISGTKITVKFAGFYALYDATYDDILQLVKESK